MRTRDGKQRSRPFRTRDAIGPGRRPWLDLTGRPLDTGVSRAVRGGRTPGRRRRGRKSYGGKYITACPCAAHPGRPWAAGRRTLPPVWRARLLLRRGAGRRHGRKAPPGSARRPRGQTFHDARYGIGLRRNGKAYGATRQAQAMRWIASMRQAVHPVTVRAVCAAAAVCGDNGIRNGRYKTSFAEQEPPPDFHCPPRLDARDEAAGKAPKRCGARSCAATYARATKNVRAKENPA